MLSAVITSRLINGLLGDLAFIRHPEDTVNIYPGYNINFSQSRSIYGRREGSLTFPMKL